jgi:hypothetical protein
MSLNLIDPLYTRLFFLNLYLVTRRGDQNCLTADFKIKHFDLNIADNGDSPDHALLIVKTNKLKKHPH